MQAKLIQAFTPRVTQSLQRRSCGIVKHFAIFIKTHEIILSICDNKTSAFSTCIIQEHTSYLPSIDALTKSKTISIGAPAKITLSRSVVLPFASNEARQIGYIQNAERITANEQQIHHICLASHNRRTALHECVCGGLC